MWKFYPNQSKPKKKKNYNSNYFSFFRTNYHSFIIIRIMLEIQTILQKNLQTVDVVNDY